MREKGAALTLVIFDLDGTLVDSAGVIVQAMRQAFHETGLPAPPPEAVRDVIGLTLSEAIVRLLAGIQGPAIVGPAIGPHPALASLCDGYRRAFLALDTGADTASVLFPGIEAVLGALEEAGHLLAVATGKGRRGLNRVLDRHGLERRFVATRTPDEAPGKPHPGMVLDILAATGARASDTLVIGDSLFDMQMAGNAGVAGLGVAWGAGEKGALLASGAFAVARRPDEIPSLVGRGLGLSATARAL